MPKIKAPVKSQKSHFRALPENIASLQNKHGNKGEFHHLRAGHTLMVMLKYHRMNANIRLKHSTIAREAGISISSVKRGIEELIELGWITRKRTGRASIYMLTGDPADFGIEVWRLRRKARKREWAKAMYIRDHDYAPVKHTCSSSPGQAVPSGNSPVSSERETHSTIYKGLAIPPGFFGSKSKKAKG